VNSGESAERREPRRRIKLLGQENEAQSAGVPVAGKPAGKRLYPLVSELAAAGVRVAVTCGY
jgi:hypothetical protein